MASGVGNIRVKVGQASKVAKKSRLSWLFNGHVPTSEVQMQKYLQRIDVPIYVGKGKRRTMVLTVHKKLASEYYAIFTEMCKIKFKIKSGSTYAYCWRNIANSSSRSQHSYGCAIDVNSGDNPDYHTNANVSNGYGNYRPYKNPYSVTKEVIAIWKAHGFNWGGNWTGYKDTMHFSYTEW